MATVTKWTPFGVALNITATNGGVTRTSATKYTVKINVSWESYYSSAKTNYGMSASAGGGSATINKFGTKAASGSGSFTGTFSISGNGSATKTITVTFKNYNNDNGDSATKTVSFNVTVPAWTSYTVKYNANGGSGAPSSQTKWKDQTLKLSSTTPTRPGHTFLGWGTTSTDTSVNYVAGANYTSNAAITLYAIWDANEYSVTYNKNTTDTVTNMPANTTKTYGQTLTLASNVPERKYYNFLGWGISATTTVASYKPGSSYTANTGIALYAIWELAYVKPRIENVAVNRCKTTTTTSEDGTEQTIVVLTDDGTSALVTFDWATDFDVTSITIEYKRTIDESWTMGPTISASGTKGSVSQIIGSDDSEDESALSTEYTYDVKITVTDRESSYEPRSISSLNFPVDVYKRGAGIAFGKVAEEEDVTDSAWPIYPRKGFIYPLLEKGQDLNDVMQPGVYHGNAATTYEYVNCPITSAMSFTLEVYPAGDNGQLLQRVTSCSKDNSAVYERFYYTSAWGDWIQTNLSIQQVVKAMSTAYGITPTITPGANYTSVTGGSVLVGNNLRVNMSATRSSKINAGNITNEVIATFTIDTGGKVKSMYVSSVSTATTGAALLSISGNSVSNGIVTFNIVAAAIVGASEDQFNAYFSMPVTLDISKY